VALQDMNVKIDRILGELERNPDLPKGFKNEIMLKLDSLRWGGKAAPMLR
jgi:hypothetical protein